MTLLRRTRRAVFGISPEEVLVTRRGFHVVETSTVSRLERVGTEFLRGFHAALEDASGAVLASRLNREVEPEFRGFAFEGAGMALMLLDRLHLERNSLADFLAGPGDPHKYMVIVGAGWAFARLPWLRARLDRAMAPLDPVLRWLAVDGYGFHEGYFHWPESIGRCRLPRGVTGYAVRAFDQGLGRSLWFVQGIQPEPVAAAIARFPSSRHADLWSGVGLACTYAGGADRPAILRLRELAGAYVNNLAQGASFAAEARIRAGNPVQHSDLVCHLVCGMSAEEAAAIPREELSGLPADGQEPAYEVWRQRIQRRLAERTRRVPP